MKYRKHWQQVGKEAALTHAWRIMVLKNQELQNAFALVWWHPSKPLLPSWASIPLQKVLKGWRKKRRKKESKNPKEPLVEWSCYSLLNLSGWYPGVGKPWMNHVITWVGSSSASIIMKLTCNTVKVCLERSLSDYKHRNKQKKRATKCNVYPGLDPQPEKGYW